MKLFKALSLIPIAFGSLLSVSANEYKFEDIKFDQVKLKQDTYKPKDKLDEYIIKGATYSTKFVPLMNNGAEGSEYILNLQFIKDHLVLLLRVFPTINVQFTTAIILTHKIIEFQASITCRNTNIGSHVW